MNSIFNLILAAAVLFSGAPGTVAKVESLNRCDEYTITYQYQGDEQRATVSGYDFNNPPTVGDTIPIKTIQAKYKDDVTTYSGTLHRFEDTRGEWWLIFPQDCREIAIDSEQTYTLIYHDNGTDFVEDDILLSIRKAAK